MYAKLTFIDSLIEKLPELEEGADDASKYAVLAAHSSGVTDRYHAMPVKGGVEADPIPSNTGF